MVINDSTPCFDGSCGFVMFHAQRACKRGGCSSPSFLSPKTATGDYNSNAKRLRYISTGMLVHACTAAASKGVGRSGGAYAFRGMAKALCHVCVPPTSTMVASLQELVHS
eukprot:2046882-Amphidinium_carterae.1